MCNNCFKCFFMPSTATGDLANAPIKATLLGLSWIYLRLDKQPQDAIQTDPGVIAEIEAWLATGPQKYDCDTMAVAVQYQLEVGDLVDEKVTFTFTKPDGTVESYTVDFSNTLNANELGSSDQSITIVVTADDPSNGTDDQKVDLKANFITTTNSICIDLGAGKKAWGKYTRNSLYGDFGLSALAGSELFEVTITDDDTILPLGFASTLGVPFEIINSDCPCDCAELVF